MDHAALLGEEERLRALEHDVDHLLDRQQARDAGVVLERAPGHVLHHDVARVLVIDRIEDRRDVGVRQLAHQRRFVQVHVAEAAGHALVGPVHAGEQLDRHLALGKRIGGQVHAAGRAPPQFAQDPVLADLLREIVAHARVGSHRENEDRMGMAAGGQ